MISWTARLWDADPKEPPLAILAAPITFDDSGNVIATSSSPGSIATLVEFPSRSRSESDHGPGPSPRPQSEPDHDWSPDGTQLVYCQFGDLVVLDRASGKTTTLCAGRAPRWSPDGQRIAFCNPARSIQTIATDGGDLRTIAEIPRYQDVSLSPPGMMRAPVWSPDSRHILYAYRKPASSRDVNIYRIPAEGGEALNLTADIERPDMWVAWRPSTLPKP
jgi:dipeptidyl aminopeptidase/acylaminoacyl peptidase